MTSTAHKDKHGNIEWRNAAGQLHRENGPAIEYAEGTREWWINGERHRENGPAIEGADGSKMWWLNGQLHRENGPALDYPNGHLEYWINNQSGPEIEQQVKENIARIHAEKDQQELLDALSQDQDVSDKINTSSPKIHKKL